MANFLMNPVVPGFTSDMFASTVKLVSSQEGASFASYIEKKSAEFGNAGNLLGVKGEIATDIIGVHSQKATISEEQAVSSIAELLEQFMAQLNELAGKKDIGAGEWQLTGLDPKNLENLAEKAGMESSELAALISKTEDGGSTLGLVDFFSALERTFTELDLSKPVIAQETSLPLLQTILTKLGVSESDIVQISEASVDDFGGFDLNIFLDGLNSLETPVPTEILSQGQGQVTSVPLTDWQVEQLQDMLSVAGMTKATEIQLFPEKTVEIFKGVDALKVSFDNSESTVQMGLGRLKSMLQETINDSESAQPKVDLPGFLMELKSVLGQAEFKDAGVGWSPVVQNSIASVFEELQKIVDFSQIKIESRAGEYLTAWDEKFGASGKDGAIVGRQQLSNSVSHVVESEASSMTLTSAEPDSVGNRGKVSVNPVPQSVEMPVVEGKASVENIVITKIGAGGERQDVAVNIANAVGGEKIEKGFSDPRKDSPKNAEASLDSKVLFPNSENSKVVNEISRSGGDLSKNSSHKDLKQEVDLSMPHVVVDETKNADTTKVTNRSHPTAKPPLQQLTFEQISTGVLRGLKDSQRHLTMTLHPKELGEVKVDMLLRDNHVSLSFLMDTPKVKEILESSMQDLRQNMSQNGFELGQCSVSVNQDNDSQTASQQFAAGRHKMNEQARKASLSEINDIVAAGQELRASYHDGQISVIA